MMLWTLPNILSATRVACLPLIIWLLHRHVESPYTCFWAAMIYILAGITDIVDGVIARRTNQVTVFGKFFDPLVDKLFYLVTLVALLELPEPRVPGWIVMVVIVRELSITGLRSMAAAEGIVLAADRWGKLKTTLATIGTVGLLLHYSYFIDFGPVAGPIHFQRVGLWVTYCSVAVSLWSGLQYIRVFVQGLSARKS